MNILSSSLVTTLLCSLAFTGNTYAQAAPRLNPSELQAPLDLERTYTLPKEVKGNFDHLEIDAKHNRIFVTAKDAKGILVIDRTSGQVIAHIENVARPHAILYRDDLDLLYVTDGGDGSLKIYDGESFHLQTRIPLLKDADSIGYDISRHLLYIDNGGGDAGEKDSTISVINTDNKTKIHNFRIPGETLEAMTLDNYRPHLYVNDAATNHVVVLDRFSNRVLHDWPITMGKNNVAMALDEQRQRLFIGCRSGQIVVLDSNTGKELQTLPIAGGVDDLLYDAVTRRVYAVADGVIDTFEQKDLDHYVALPPVSTGAGARTGRLSAQGGTIFVAVPASGQQSARVLAFHQAHIVEHPLTPADAKQPVDAPVAERIVLETLSAHPLLRRIGLHVIPPGGSDMILIANGNATRLGIRTSEGDFAAVKDGGIYGPKIEDGQFYNMKMPMFDAQHRPIGILVMEIACTDASSAQDAAAKAATIREELAAKIPSKEFLFTKPSGL